MESWGEIAQRIYKTFNENGYKYLVDEMISEYGIGGTPGEMFSIVCIWLAKMRNAKNEAYDLVRKDAATLLNYSVELKYFTKHYLDRL
jgi:hypothetical protein